MECGPEDDKISGELTDFQRIPLQASLISRSSSKHGRKPAWMNKMLLTKLINRKRKNTRGGNRGSRRSVEMLAEDAGVGLGKPKPTSI